MIQLALQATPNLPSVRYPTAIGNSYPYVVVKPTRQAELPAGQTLWLLLRCLLIRPQTDSPEDHGGRCSVLAQRFQGPAPAKIIRQVFGGDAMEAAQPLFQAAVVGIDVVEVKIRRLWVGLARHRQDVSRDPSPPRKSNDRRAAIAAELIGWCDTPSNAAAMDIRFNRRSTASVVLPRGLAQRSPGSVRRTNHVWPICHLFCATFAAGLTAYP